ncbi:hypothetical protein EDC02_2866 [Micromonospora sp. Llam0]|uniref:hypothetical protein n=1 Tax=Micromonospora sp. Llam0 TaxID=2485143 RepID=UPI000F4A5793|nr:hypothetical protein [Micromonospora sp. Llam0]ROO60945.1 hypothetical protein EDC02_2866 [Micromonospora sp. Llam0]
MFRDRVIACLLFAVAFAGLVVQRISPFSDIPWATGSVVTFAAVVSALTGVWLWGRSTRRRSGGTDSDGEAPSEAGADAGGSGD